MEEKKMSTDMKIGSTLQKVFDSIEVDLKNKQAIVKHRETIYGDSLRNLKQLLAQEIYLTFHSGGHVSQEEKNLKPLRNQEIETTLKSVIPHEQTVKTGIYLGEISDGSNAVKVNFSGVVICVPKEKILGGTPINYGGKILVTTPACRPSLSRGFFMVDGLYSLEQYQLESTNLKPPRRYYIHTNSYNNSAIVWEHMLPVLNYLKIPYRTKALSFPSGYPRNDAVVFYIPNQFDNSMRQALQFQLGNADCVEFGESIFAEKIMDGVSTSEEPFDIRVGYNDLSFGEHRSHVMAEAILNAASYEHASYDTVVAQAFIDANISPFNPSRNLSTF